VPLFGPEALEAAFDLFDFIVDGDLSRALSLDPVVRWPLDYWATLSAAARTAKFNRRDHQHLAALQLIIDRACERELRREAVSY